ncbi:O-acyltransferase like protein-like [Haliotis cracherodii]|uniref:O-acyltransferase like protein-like n=1 Tax=Haliotis cracherodii TaxID=6455 RepID=UPI0039ED3DD6
MGQDLVLVLLMTTASVHLTAQSTGQKLNFNDTEQTDPSLNNPTQIGSLEGHITKTRSQGQGHLPHVPHTSKDVHLSTKDVPDWTHFNDIVEATISSFNYLGLPVFFPLVWAGIIQAGVDIYSYNVTDDCKVELSHYAVDLQNRKDWAVRMFDATGRQGSGFLQGSVTWQGDYDQCSNIRHTMTSLDTGSDVTREIIAQYCSLSFDSPIWLDNYISHQHLPFPVHLPHLTVDICIPSGCDEDDITTIINTYAGQQETNISLSNIRCQKDMQLAHDAAAIFSVCLLAAFACLVFLGSMVTVIVRLKTTAGQLNSGPCVGYFSRRGNVFTVARQHSVFYNRCKLYSKSIWAGSLYRQDSMKIVSDHRTTLTPSTDHVNDVVISVQKSPSARLQNQAMVQMTRKGDSPLGKRKEIKIQNGVLQPIGLLSLPVRMDFRQNDKFDLSQQVSLTPGGVVTDILLCFSLPNNLASVLGGGNPDQLLFLSGIRFLSICWVVFGNTISFIHRTPDVIENSVTLVELAECPLFQAIINSTFASDSFFILSGTLLSYNFLRTVEKKKSAGKEFRVTPKFLLLFYLHRLLRILPCYLVVLMIFANLMPYMGHGPRWKYATTAVNQCRDHWWANVFFFSNFYMADEMCMSWTFFLVNDTQFYLISPLILIPLVRLPSLGFALLGLLVATQLVSVGILNNKINGNMLRMDSGYFSDVYAKPYCRVGVFAIGMMLGYILNKVGRRTHLRKIPMLLGWLMSFCTMALVIYITYLENRVGGRRFTAIEAGVYEALARPAWGLALSWVIFACAVGQGGFINTFLSWNYFFPLCRITFGIYLLHPLVIMLVRDTSRSLIHFSPFGLWLLYVPILVMATMLALVLITCIQQPFITLETLIRNIT